MPGAESGSTRPHPAGGAAAGRRWAIIQHVAHEGPGLIAGALDRARPPVPGGPGRPRGGPARSPVDRRTGGDGRPHGGPRRRWVPVAGPRTGTDRRDGGHGPAGARRLPGGPTAGRRPRCRGDHRAGGRGGHRTGRVDRRRPHGPGDRSGVRGTGGQLDPLCPLAPRHLLAAARSGSSGRLPALSASGLPLGGGGLRPAVPYRGGPVPGRDVAGPSPARRVVGRTAAGSGGSGGPPPPAPVGGAMAGGHRPTGAGPSRPRS